MRFRATFKSPDAIYHAANEAAESAISSDVEEFARSEMVEEKRHELTIAVDKWVKYGEYVTIEFDTEKGTATVCEV